MTHPFAASIKKLALEPGVLFPVANVFTFMQTDNRLAVGLAVANVVFSVIAALRTSVRFSPLLITACMVFLSGLCSLWSGAVLAGMAGFVFATGAYFSANKRIMDALQNPDVAPMIKVATHPAVYFGIGYIVTGMMAGGGIGLLTHPFDNLSALIMVGFGAATIIMASVGLALNLLKSSIPFWIQAAGTGINALAGLVVGNWVGAASCTFSMLGTLRLALLTHTATKQSFSGEHHGF